MKYIQYIIPKMKWLHSQWIRSFPPHNIYTVLPKPVNVGGKNVFYYTKDLKVEWEYRQRMEKNEEGINLLLCFFLFKSQLRWPCVIVHPCINTNSCRSCGGIIDNTKLVQNEKHCYCILIFQIIITIVLLLIVDIVKVGVLFCISL